MTAFRNTRPHCLYLFSHQCKPSSYSIRCSKRDIGVSRRNESSLPPPTWSLRQLQLSSSSTATTTTPSISDQELNVLARRCLIDIKDEEREELKKNLNNILHCTSLVCTVEKDDTVILNEEDFYDVPRGLGSKSSCPVRRDNETNQKEKSELSEMKAKEVLDELKRQGKMVTNESHKDVDKWHKENWYFSLVTKEKTQT